MIGQLLKEIRYQSFYINEELVERFNKVFLHFEEDGWVSVVISEGELSLEKEDEPALTDHSEIIDDFKYPVEIFDTYLALPDTLLSVKTLTCDKSFTVGAIFQLVQTVLLIIVDENDDMIIWHVNELSTFS